MQDEEGTADLRRFLDGGTGKSGDLVGAPPAVMAEAARRSGAAAARPIVRKAPDLIRTREAENDRHRDADHAKMRTAIVAWVKKTGMKALLCPEMTYQVELLKPLLFDPLPDDVKPRVVIRPGYRLTDEAAATYRRAAVVVSLEMHSPIIAIANGRSTIHLRQPTDTRRGQMWRDVGLQDWLFEIAERLLALQGDPERTAATVAKARDYAAARGRALTEAVARNQ